MKQNILVGHNVGSELTTEKLRLIVKSKSVDIDKTMTENEFELLNDVILAILENFHGSICSCNCVKFTTGACSTSIGRPALACQDICVKLT